MVQDCANAQPTLNNMNLLKIKFCRRNIVLLKVHWYKIYERKGKMTKSLLLFFLKKRVTRKESFLI